MGSLSFCLLSFGLDSVLMLGMGQGLDLNGFDGLCEWTNHSGLF